MTTNNNQQVKALQTLNWVFFGLMIFVNFLANYLPINGKNTGELSNQYPNLFVPAPVTFAIWGVIYLLVLIFCIVQSKSLLSVKIDEQTAKIVNAVGYRFILSCTANFVWILSWHYELQATSVLIMLGLLSSLIAVNQSIIKTKSSISNFQHTISKSAFGVYLGWICVATVANVTAMLVHYQWGRFGLSQEIWTSALILIAGGIASFTLLKINNFYLGFAVLWAFNGIYKVRITDILPPQNIIISLVIGALIVLIAMGLSLSKKQLFMSK